MGVRKATIDDALLLFNWASDVSVRANSIDTSKIVWENHLAWLKTKLKSDSILLIFEEDGHPIGQIRFDYDDSKNYWTIDYSIGNEYRGKGMGKAIVAYGVEYLNRFPVVAHVRPTNIYSIKVFESLGFNNTGVVEVKGIEVICFSKKN